MKIGRKYGEECKVSIRKARHDAIDMLDALDGEASSDDIDRTKTKVEDTVKDGTKGGRHDDQRQGERHPRGLR